MTPTIIERNGGRGETEQYSPALPPVLDATCGSRMMWFDKKDSRAIYFDRRDESHAIEPNRANPKGTTITISPDVIGDFTSLPFADESFYLVVFDPPHLSNLGANGIIAKKYGRLTGDWECEIREGLAECLRVLKPNGTLIFKWCSTEIPLSKVIAMAPIKPLFGHNTGNHAKTHWITFLKPDTTISRLQHFHNPNP